MYGQGRELEIGNATSAVVISLIQALVRKDVLSNDEARILLTKAAIALGVHDYAGSVRTAMDIILNDMMPIFPEEGGD